MGASGLVFDELVSQIARKAAVGIGESRTEPVMDQESGELEGVLIESPFERVLIFSQAQPTLSLSDLSRMRRLMVRAQARRALLYVPIATGIPKPVMLMATLSKIEIVRLAAAFSL